MTPKPIRIDSLSLADVEAVTRIYSEIINPSYIAYGELTEGLSTLKAFPKKAPELFRREIKRFIKGGARKIYVARNDNDLTGFVYLEIKKALGGNSECWILDLGVDKRFRRMGIAKKLMDAAYTFGKKNNVKYFLLESGEKNKGAHQLFEKEGFSRLATIFVKEKRKRARK